MSLETDLQEVKAKVEALLTGVQNGEPTLAELVFQAVEQVFLNAGYAKPSEPETSATEAPEQPEGAV